MERIFYNEEIYYHYQYPIINIDYWGNVTVTYLQSYFVIS
jgi:hypothetical protein